MIIQRTFRDLDSAGRVSTTRVVNFPSQAAQAQYLRALVKEYRSHLPIREKAVEIVRGAGVKPKNRLGQVLAIGKWGQDWKKNFYYVNEPDETFQTPLRTLRSGFGDCDDLAVLTATLCEALAIPCKLITVGRWPNMSHIYAQAVVVTPRGIIQVPLDGTLLQYKIGFDPMAIARKKWPLLAHARTF